MVKCNNRGQMPHQNGARNDNCICSDERKQLIRKLQKIDFSLVDTVLYLDAYPNCKKALAYYHKLLEEKNKILSRLNDIGSPMNNMSNTADTWNWTKAPWPWEYEAN